MGQLFQFNTANDFIATVDYVAQTAQRAQFLKFQNIDQAKQLAMTAITRGVDMLEVCLTFDIISGRLCKKAAAMLAEFKARGGKYKILSRTPELASIEFTYDGQTQVMSLSWDIVQHEDYTKEKDGKTFKPRYANPHGRTQMLWARLISDSVRTIAPEVTGGYYTPEEMEDITDGECTTIPMNAGSLPGPGGSNSSTVTQSSQAATQTATVNAQVDVMISSEQQTHLEQLFAILKITPEQIAVSLKGRGVSQVSELTAAQATEIIGVLQAKVDPRCTAEQQLELQSLFVMLGVTPEQIAASLATRGVSKLDELTQAQAAEAIATLRSKLPSNVGQSTIQTNGSITKELAAKLEEAVKLCAQVEGGAAITEAVFTHLQKHGLLMHQLTLAEGERLLCALEQRQVSLFLDLALNGAQGKA